MTNAICVRRCILHILHRHPPQPRRCEFVKRKANSARQSQKPKSISNMFTQTAKVGTRLCCGHWAAILRLAGERMDSAEVLNPGLRADSISPVVPHVSVVHILSLSPLLASECICDTAVCWLASSLLACFPLPQSTNQCDRVPLRTTNPLAATHLITRPPRLATVLPKLPTNQAVNVLSMNGA